MRGGKIDKTFEFCCVWLFRYVIDVTIQARLSDHSDNFILNHDSLPSI